MPCGLSKDALDVLYKLVWTRAVSAKHSRSIKRIRHDLPDSVDVDSAIHELANRGLVGSKRKNDVNYWANLGDAMRVLIAHDYPVRSGGRYPL